MIHFLGKWWFGPLSGIMARFDFLDVLWAIWVLACVEKMWFCGACVLIDLAFLLFGLYVFSSGSVWVILTCGTFPGSVAFGAEFEEEEEEAEPEDAAPPGC